MQDHNPELRYDIVTVSKLISEARGQVIHVRSAGTYEAIVEVVTKAIKLWEDPIHQAANDVKEQVHQTVREVQQQRREKGAFLLTYAWKSSYTSDSMTE